MAEARGQSSTHRAQVGGSDRPYLKHGPTHATQMPPAALPVRSSSHPSEMRSAAHATDMELTHASNLVI